MRPELSGENMSQSSAGTANVCCRFPCRRNEGDFWQGGAARRTDSRFSSDYLWGVTPPATDLRGGAELYEISTEHGPRVTWSIKKFVLNFRHIVPFPDEDDSNAFGENLFRTPSSQSCVHQTAPNLRRT